jgi:hypothetical protein
MKPGFFGDLPQMATGIGEVAGIAPVEGLGCSSGDLGARSPVLVKELVHLLS